MRTSLDIECYSRETVYTFPANETSAYFVQRQDGGAIDSGVGGEGRGGGVGCGSW